jgi:hypothetical protein
MSFVSSLLSYWDTSASYRLSEHSEVFKQPYKLWAFKQMIGECFSDHKRVSFTNRALGYSEGLGLGGVGRKNGVLEVFLLDWPDLSAMLR